MEVVSETRAFGGLQGVYRHASRATGTDMTFALFLPPQAQGGVVPVLWFLSGLTCTHENAMTKAGAQGWAAEEGLALVFPDTSPRGEGVPDDPAMDLGQGAGFYLNATQDPWARNFRMEDYITRDLPDLVFEAFPLDPDAQGITGHSMGGHGALTLAMARPEIYRSVSAIAPITRPTTSDWGRRQLTAYLGSDESTWAAHDATAMMEATGYPGPLLIDQGGADPFLDRLQPEALLAAAARRRQPIEFRLHEGYDHSYFFVASVMADHVRWHGEQLL